MLSGASHIIIDILTNILINPTYDLSFIIYSKKILLLSKEPSLIWSLTNHLTFLLLLCFFKKN